MTALHRRFMQINAPTDVMTFELEHDRRGRPMGGEVIVCVSEARRIAGPSRRAIRRELLLYSLHGMLHLSGFDDRTDRDFQRMHRMEDKLLEQLGIGAVFDHSPMRARTPRPTRSRTGPTTKDSPR
jgi:probable rRNA maturation factor